MRKSFLCVLLVCAVMLASCGKLPQENMQKPENVANGPSQELPDPSPEPEPSVEVAPSVELESSVEPEPSLDPEPSSEPSLEPEPSSQPEETTEPEHSPLYISYLAVEDVILYFNEVCLDAEFNYDGTPDVLQKWVYPIHYAIYGEPTPEDRQKLEQFCQWLNTIEGFPGIQPEEDPNLVNLRIYFTTREEIPGIMEDDYGYVDGAVRFWYIENQIYDAIICYSTEADQYLRNSVILEELYNGLGPVQDTQLRQESIIYAGYSEPQWVTAIDELILQLLYHPSMECGMDAAACEAVIRALYY